MSAPDPNPVTLTPFQQVQARQQDMAATLSGFADAATAAAQATAALTAAAAQAPLTARVAWLESRQARSAPSVAVPAVTTVAGTASVDVALVWTSPWPDNGYSAVAWLEAPASLLGKASCAVSTRTAAGCVVTVTTSAVIAAGSVVVRALSVTA